MRNRCETWDKVQPYSWYNVPVSKHTNLGQGVVGHCKDSDKVQGTPNIPSPFHLQNQDSSILAMKCLDSPSSHSSHYAALDLFVRTPSLPLRVASVSLATVCPGFARIGEQTNPIDPPSRNRNRNPAPRPTIDSVEEETIVCNPNILL